MQLSVTAQIISILSAGLALLGAWWITGERSLSHAKKLLLRSPLMLALFLFAWLLEKTVGTSISLWLAIILAAPLAEEIARYLATDLLDLESANDGFFIGALTGITETLIFLWLYDLKEPELLFRLFFSQPLHAILGATLACGGSLTKNIIIHFLFNYGIFIGGYVGIFLSVFAMTLGILNLFLAAQPLTSEEENADKPDR
ncbi:MAG: hypothetical protein ACOYXC_02750 [Candidatus Rifleibacteriota bacterium]